MPGHTTDLQTTQGFRDALANLHPTPDVQLDPQLPVNSFKWGTGVFYRFLLGIAVLYRVKYNVEKISTLDLEEDE